MTCKTMNGQYELNKEANLPQCVHKKISWTNETKGMKVIYPILANNYIPHNKMVSGTVVDASDYIRYKRLLLLLKVIQDKLIIIYFFI